MRNTKIVATVGPASESEEILARLIDAGVDVFRLNFSHGDHGGHEQALHDIRAAADGCERVVAVLQDLCGPKIRLGPIPGDAVDCHPDETRKRFLERRLNGKRLARNMHGPTRDQCDGSPVHQVGPRRGMGA